MQQDEALDALKAMDEAQEGLAQAVECPPWRHAAVGLVCAALVFSPSTSGFGFLAIYAPAMIAILLIARSDRRRTGLFVNGWRMGRTLPISIALLLVLLGLIWFARQGRLEPFPAPHGLAAAAVAFVVTSLVSVWWQRVYVAELRRKNAR